jgi:hypothetical protein
MIDVEHEGIELDYCTNCQGVWFDSEELELLLDKMGFEAHGLPLDDMLSRPEAETSERKRRCPICGQKMKKATMGRQPEVLIDVCPQGDGLWFDGGEVTELVKHLAKEPSKKGDPQQQVTAFLGDVFKARE